MLALLAFTTVASGCIGATDRSDFDAEVRARGGGVSIAWITEAVELVADEVGASGLSELTVMRIGIDSTDRSLNVMARRVDRPDFVDSVYVLEGDVRSITPLQDADQLPLDDMTFPVSVIPLGEIETIADVALEEFGEADGFVRRISVMLDRGVPVIEVDVDSARRTGTVVFDVDGALLEIER